MRHANYTEQQQKLTETAKSFLSDNLASIKFGLTSNRALNVVTPFKYVHSNGNNRSGSILVEQPERHSSKLVVKIIMNTTSTLSDATIVQRSLRKQIVNGDELVYDDKSVARLLKIQTYTETEFEAAEEKRARDKKLKEEKNSLTEQLTERGFEFEYNSCYSSGKGFTQRTKLNNNQIEMTISTSNVELAAKIKELLDSQG